MAKFSIEITRRDKYEVEVDESVWTPEELEKWARTFYPTETTEDFAKHVAEAIFFKGMGAGFMEGFGYVRQNYAGREKKQRSENGIYAIENEYTKGLFVDIIDYNEDLETVAEEM